MLGHTLGSLVTQPGCSRGTAALAAPQPRPMAVAMRTSSCMVCCFSVRVRADGMKARAVCSRGAVVKAKRLKMEKTACEKRQTEAERLVGLGAEHYNKYKKYKKYKEVQEVQRYIRNTKKYKIYKMHKKAHSYKRVQIR
jgi:hypothetical protein